MSYYDDFEAPYALYELWTKGKRMRSAVQSCTKCHGEKSWQECWNCDGEGLDGHDCGEDCCVCLHPDDNMRCDICRGKGGWYRCYTCAPITGDEA